MGFVPASVAGYEIVVVPGPGPVGPAVPKRRNVTQVVV